MAVRVTSGAGGRCPEGAKILHSTRRDVGYVLSTGMLVAASAEAADLAVVGCRRRPTPWRTAALARLPRNRPETPNRRVLGGHGGLLSDGRRRRLKIAAASFRGRAGKRFAAALSDNTSVRSVSFALRPTEPRCCNGSSGLLLLLLQGPPMSL